MVHFDVVAEIMIMGHSKYSEDHLATFFEHIDTNGDGSLDFSEYLRFLKNFEADYIKTKRLSNVRKVFDNFSVANEEGDEDEDDQVINLESFKELCLKEKLFSRATQDLFM